VVNILFVCSANKQRSKTASDYFSEKEGRNTTVDLRAYGMGRYHPGDGRKAPENYR